MARFIEMGVKRKESVAHVELERWKIYETWLTVEQSVASKLLP